MGSKSEEIARKSKDLRRHRTAQRKKEEATTHPTTNFVWQIQFADLNGHPVRCWLDDRRAFSVAQTYECGSLPDHETSYHVDVCQPIIASPSKGRRDYERSGDETGRQLTQLQLLRRCGAGHTHTKKKVTERTCVSRALCAACRTVCARHAARFVREKKKTPWKWSDCDKYNLQI
ncbi:Hypothetical protein, putative [Bodo saltans]|uniref:Uncharacterized protein n=1 Tax=Bodo saltans TaxID=75058 RepID=A0A0S4JQ98_BODSA|nr:Hypothetical protein, putative [Bodo saltans]|eukprot:CUG92507.1 Hypothetical protein, putative [Bodo saltans]